MGLIPRKTALPLLLQKPQAFARTYWLPLLVLVLGAAADCVTTLINARQYGPGVELHLAHWLVQHLMGATLGVPVGKALQLGFVLAVAAWWRPWCAWILTLCGLLYLAAAVSNHFLLL